MLYHITLWGLCIGAPVFALLTRLALYMSAGHGTDISVYTLLGAPHISNKYIMLLADLPLEVQILIVGLSMLLVVKNRA